MDMLIETPRATSNAALQREIDRFLVCVRQRGHTQATGHRRKELRHERSWPLQIERLDLPDSAGLSVALHNASASGIAFLTADVIPPDTMIEVQLFWQRDAGPTVPAIVRHATATEHGYLIGAEFLVDDDAD